MSDDIAAELISEYNRGYENGHRHAVNTDLEILLRDKFAMACLPMFGVYIQIGALCDPQHSQYADAHADVKKFAKIAYIFADALLAEREKKG